MTCIEVCRELEAGQSAILLTNCCLSLELQLRALVGKLRVFFAVGLLERLCACSSASLGWTRVASSYLLAFVAGVFCWLLLGELGLEGLVLMAELLFDGLVSRGGGFDAAKDTSFNRTLGFNHSYDAGKFIVKSGGKSHLLDALRFLTLGDCKVEGSEGMGCS